MIACLPVADFALCLSPKRNPHLHADHLIVAHYQQDRGKVYAASPQGMQAGVIRGMGIRQSCRMYPEAQVVSASIAYYQRQLEALVTILRDYAKTALQTLWPGHSQLPHRRNTRHFPQTETSV